MTKQIQINSDTFARVLNRKDRGFYQEVEAKTAEKFGINSLAYKTITNGINTQNVTGSQFFWNTNLGLYLPKNQRVVSLEDMEAINDLNEHFFDEFVSDPAEILLKTENAPPSMNERYILKDLIRQINEQKFEFSLENPLRISGVELVKDENLENKCGLLMKIGSNTKIINDKRFANSGDFLIQFGKRQKKYYRDDFFGFTRIFSGVGGHLFASCYNFDDSGKHFGRVVIIEQK